MSGGTNGLSGIDSSRRAFRARSAAATFEAKDTVTIFRKGKEPQR